MDRDRLGWVGAHRLVLRSTTPGSRRHALRVSHHVQLPKWLVKYARASSEGLLLPRLPPVRWRSTLMQRSCGARSGGRRPVAEIPPCNPRPGPLRGLRPTLCNLRPTLCNLRPGSPRSARPRRRESGESSLGAPPAAMQVAQAKCSDHLVRVRVGVRVRGEGRGRGRGRARG